MAKHTAKKLVKKATKKKDTSKRLRTARKKSTK
jgi:hypothetical protein